MEGLAVSRQQRSWIANRVSDRKVDLCQQEEEEEAAVVVVVGELHRRL